MGSDRRTTYAWGTGNTATFQTVKTVTDLAASQLVEQTTYSYNLQGGMSQAVIERYTGGTLVQCDTSQFVYGDDGIRVSATHKIETGSGTLTVTSDNKATFLNDPQNHTAYSQVLVETTVNNLAGGAILKTVISTLGHDLLCQTTISDPVGNPSGVTLHLLYDGHGSTRLLTDAAGAIAVANGVPQVFTYDAYGNGVGFDPSQAATTYLYSGEQWDQRVAMQYLRARYYVPVTGGFIGLDPFDGDSASPLTLHKYAYAHLDPVNGVDPTGWSLFAFDGTWNWEGEMADDMAPLEVWSPTNVWKMYKASSDPNAHYYRGPGNAAENGWLGQTFGGGFGYGMANILDRAWDDLLADRAAGDHTADIVGFSRGSVEATEFANRIADAFPDEQIRFVGLYDPVATVGAIPYRFGNYRKNLPSNVGHGVVALARDEDRTLFPPTYVVGADVQRWFHGNHSDVGGGWADQQLSDYALQWMLGEAQIAGLSLDLNQTLAATYEGHRLTFNPNPNAPPHSGGMFTILGSWDRKFSFAVWTGMPVAGLGQLNGFISSMASSIVFSLGF